MVEYKRPEYVILDDTQDEVNPKQTDKIVALYKKARSKYREPISIIQSLIYLIAGLLSAFWASCIFWVVLFCAIMAGIALGGNETLNAHLKSALTYFQKYVVATLGFLVSVFSPALGMSLIEMYGLLKESR